MYGGTTIPYHIIVNLHLFSAVLYCMHTRVHRSKTREEISPQREPENRKSAGSKTHNEIKNVNDSTVPTSGSVFSLFPAFRQNTGVAEYNASRKIKRNSEL